MTAPKRKPPPGFPDLMALFPKIGLNAPAMGQGFPAFGFGGLAPAAPAAPGAPAAGPAPAAANGPAAAAAPAPAARPASGPATGPADAGDAADDTVYTRPEAAGDAAGDTGVAAGGGDGQPSRQGGQALEVARREIGVAEDPPESNRGARVEQYQNGNAGQPWCAHFVSWCVEQTGKSPFGHQASVAGLRDWAKGHGKYLASGQATPLPGDIFTMARYDKAGQLVGGHTGFVSGYDAKTRRITTVEGNAGDRVKAGGYAVSVLDGFVRL